MKFPKPDYADWLKKACWSETEILYLMMELDPGCQPGGILVDLDSGEIRDAPVHPAVFKAASKAAAIGLTDLVCRAIKAGHLKPTTAGTDCYTPEEVLRYLEARIALPNGTDRRAANG